MNIFKGKSTRTRIFTVITVAIILLALALNLVLGYFGIHKTLFLDLTYEGFYTLTDAMKKECSFIDELDGKVEIIFCDDPDRLISQTVTRVLYFMSVMLDNSFENLETKTVNVTLNPTAVSKYKTTSLAEIEPDDVIISYGDRYRVVKAEVFWYRDGSDQLFSYNGEYKMASLIKSITAFSNAGGASAYFLTGNGETYYDEAEPNENRELLNFIHALEDAGLTVKTLDINSEEIPEDCALIVINNPKTDFLPEADKENEFYYISPLEKLDRYLISDYGTIMVAKDHETELPLFEEFLREWGFEFENAHVKDTDNSIDDADDTKTQIIGVYNTDENGYGMGIYSEFASLESAPKFIVTDTGYMRCSYGVSDSVYENGATGISRIYSPVIFTSGKATAYAKDKDGNYNLLYANEGRKDLVGITVRKQLNSVTNENKYSYVMCSNSADFFTNPFMGSSAYSNYDVLVAAAVNTTRADEHASIDLGGTSQNSSSYGGKMLISDKMTALGEVIYYKDASTPIKKNYGLATSEIVVYSVFIFLLPVAVATVGIVVKIKRKYL